VPASLKYARIERERRFLVDRLPRGLDVARARRIHDRYIDGTRLRLRELRDTYGHSEYKLTQKIPARGSRAQRGFITTMYLHEDEFRVFAVLPARTLTKIRTSLPPFGIDVFEGDLNGLVLAEAEFEPEEAAESLAIPSPGWREVTEDERFTGGRLVGASREDLRAWAAEYGINLAHVESSADE